MADEGTGTQATGEEGGADPTEGEVEGYGKQPFRKAGGKRFGGREDDQVEEEPEIISPIVRQEIDFKQ